MLGTLLQEVFQNTIMIGVANLEAAPRMLDPFPDPDVYPGL
jgi:hypothetical protein